MGVIDMLIDAAQNSSGAAVLIVLVFVAATGAVAALTGSGTAPYFAFAEVVPGLAADHHPRPADAHRNLGHLEPDASGLPSQRRSPHRLWRH